MTVSQLAAEMNVTEADLAGFIACLSVWAAKGYSFEECIEKHMAQMTNLAENSCEMVRSTGIRSIAIDWFYPEAA